MDMLANLIAQLIAARASMAGSYHAAILFILELAEDYRAAGKEWNEQLSINAWNDALTRISVTDQAKADANLLLGYVAMLEKPGTMSGEQWDKLIAERDGLIADMKAAEENAKLNNGKPRISDENERSEKVWRDAVDFALHWRIRAREGIDFKKDSNKKNPSLVALAQSVGFTKDEKDQLKVVLAVAKVKSLHIADDSDNN